MSTPKESGVYSSSTSSTSSPGIHQQATIIDGVVVSSGLVNDKGQALGVEGAARAQATMDDLDRRYWATDPLKEPGPFRMFPAAPVPSTVPAHDPAQSQVERALAQLRGAVERARAAADEAERSIKDHAGDPAYAAARVMHALAWGHANAISCVESALAASEDAHTIRRLSAEEKPR